MSTFGYFLHKPLSFVTCAVIYKTLKVIYSKVSEVVLVLIFWFVCLLFFGFFFNAFFKGNVFVLYCYLDKWLFRINLLFVSD